MRRFQRSLACGLGFASFLAAAGLWSATAPGGTITSSEGTQGIGSVGTISVNSLQNGNINTGTSFAFSTLTNTGTGTGYFAGLFAPVSQFFSNVTFDTSSGNLTIFTPDFGTFTSSSITELINDSQTGVRQFLFSGNFAKGTLGGMLVPDPASAAFTLNLTQDPPATGSISADGSLGLVAVPEPSTLALLACGGGIAAALLTTGPRRRDWHRGGTARRCR